MYQRPTAPRSIGGVLDDALRLWRQTLRYSWLPGFLLGLTAGAYALYSFSVNGGRPSPAQMLAIYRSPVTWLAYLALILLYTYLFFAILIPINDVANGTATSFRRSFGAALRLLPRALLGNLLFGLAMIGGLMLLIIPGLFVAGRLQCWAVTLIDEDTTARAALKASWRLVEGSWWRTATIYTVLFIVIYVLLVLIEAAVIATASLTVGRIDPAVLFVITQSGSTLVNVLTAGLLPAAMVAVYKDLRLRRRGEDLEARVGGLGAA
jgi:hypothetical protein